MADWVNSRALSAQEVERLSDAVAGTYCFLPGAGGVVSQDSGGASMTVDITALATGTCVINGAELATAVAAGSVTLDAADSTSPRRDAIWVDDSGNFGKTTGTPVTEDTVYDIIDDDTYVIVSPQLPDLNSDELLLAEVYVDAGVASVSDSDITDKRQFTNNRKTYIMKTADETVNTSDTLQDDDDFTFTGAINTIYRITGVLRINTGATPDIKFQWSLPSGAVGDGYINIGNGTSSANFSEASSGSIAGALTNATFFILEAEIQVAATGGTCVLQWAQNTSDASDTTIEQNSWITIERVGVYST